MILVEAMSLPVSMDVAFKIDGFAMVMMIVVMEGKNQKEILNIRTIFIMAIFSDEAKCATQNCDPIKQFQCSGQYCITVKWRCDGERDCPDGADEMVNFLN